MSWVPTIYVVGNAYPFTQGLIGLSMLFKPSNGLMTSSLGLGSLPALGLIFSLLFLAVKGISTQRFELHNILIMLVLFLVMFVPTTSVTVETITDGQVFGPYSGIPVGIAYTAGIVSEISADFSEAIGTAFQPPGATQDTEEIFGPQGYMGPLTQLEAIHGLYNQFFNNDHYDVQSMMAYMSHCESYNLSQATGTSTSGPATQTQILNAGIASNAIFSSPPPGLTVVYGPQYPNGSESMTCTAAATAIQGSINAYMNDTNGATHPALNLSYSAMKLAEPVGPVAPTGDGAGNSAIGPDTIGADLQTVFCSGGGTPSSPSQAVGCSLQSTAQTGVQFMENDIYGCLFDAGLNYARNPLSANLTGALPGYCDVINNAMTVQQTNNATSATLFGINLLPMMSILQFLFIALTPLVALIMVSAGTSGIGIAGKFIFFGIWTQSWLPVAAIINDYSQDTISNTFALGASYALGLGQGVGYAASGPGQVVPFWTSIGSLPLFFQKLELQLNAANTMLGLTPVVTLAIFTGAFTVLGRLAQDMQGASGATRGADGIEAPAMGSPTMTGATGSYSVYQRTMAGNGSPGSPLSSAAVNSTPTLSYGMATQAAEAQAAAQTGSITTSLAQAVGAASDSYMGGSTATGDGQTYQTGTSNSLADRRGALRSAGQQLANKFGVSFRHGLDLALLGKAMAGTPGGVGVRAQAAAEISGKLGLNATQAQEYGGDVATNFKEDSSLADTMSQLDSDTDMDSMGTSSKTGSDWKRVASLTGALTQSVQNQKSIRETASASEGMSGAQPISLTALSQVADAQNMPLGLMVGNRILSQLPESARNQIEAEAQTPSSRAIAGGDAGLALARSTLIYAATGEGPGADAARVALGAAMSNPVGRAIAAAQGRMQSIGRSIGPGTPLSGPGMGDIAATVSSGPNPLDAPEDMARDQNAALADITTTGNQYSDASNNFVALGAKYRNTALYAQWRALKDGNGITNGAKYDSESPGITLMKFGAWLDGDLTSAARIPTTTPAFDPAAATSMDVTPPDQPGAP